MVGVNNQIVMDIVEGIGFERKAIKQEYSISLLQVLLRHRSSLATDPRDKIFALLGLCSDSLLQADYKLEASDVYRSLTKAYLRRYRTLDIIAVPSSPFHQRPRTDPMFSANSKLLRVQAQFLDKIISLGEIRRPYHPKEPDLNSFFEQLRTECIVSQSWYKICLGNARSWETLYHTGETLFDVSWQILLAGCSLSEYTECQKQSKKVWKMFRKYLWASRMHLLPVWSFKLMDEIAKRTGKTIFIRRMMNAATENDFQFKIRRSISYRRIMRTTDNCLGLAPSLAEIGDCIVLLKGMSTPAILRLRGNMWEFIGDCYVHGIMNGEAFKDNKCKDIWLL
jgi:hypothetical protein